MRLLAVERAELEAKKLKKQLAAQKKEDGAVQLAVLKAALEKSTQQTEITVVESEHIKILTTKTGARAETEGSSRIREGKATQESGR